MGDQAQYFVHSAENSIRQGYCRVILQTGYGQNFMPSMESKLEGENTLDNFFPKILLPEKCLVIMLTHSN